MIRKQDLLDSVRIASPCHASWDAMEGDDRVRHCNQCRLNVYNIAEMDREEAIRLIQKNEGRLCVRLHQRRDGTVLTRDCPKGVWAARRKLAVAVVCGCGLMVSVAAFAVGATGGDGESPWTHVRIHDAAWRDKLPSAIRYVVDKLDPLPTVTAGAPPPVPLGRIAMGAMAGPPPPATPTAGTTGGGR